MPKTPRRAPAPPPVEAGRLDVIAEQACWDLLRRARVGRFAVAVDGEAPLVHPVNHVVAGSSIVFAAAGATPAVADGRQASFQVDGIDLLREEGWSVLARGRATSGAEPPTDDRPEAWLGGRQSWVELRVEAVSGRWLHHEVLAPVGDDRAYL